MEQEVAMINSYFKFELSPKSGNSFWIIPIEKLQCSKVFNEIFESTSIEVRSFGSENLTSMGMQYIICAKYQNSVVPLCNLEQRNQHGQMSVFNYFNSTKETKDCKLGVGKFQNGINDLILFRVSKDLIFEVYILNDQLASKEILYKDFIADRLQTELCNFNMYWYRSLYGDYRSASEGQDDLEGYNINLNLLTIY